MTRVWPHLRLTSESDMNQPVIENQNRRRLSGPLEWLVWGGVAVIGAIGFAFVAGLRGDGASVNAISMIVAALCSYAFGYRFYSKWIARKVLELDDARATPAEKFNNGHDFDPTNRLVLLGHHFAGIAGAGPLVGPVLAAQFGFCRARYGSSSVPSSPVQFRTSSCCSPRCGGTASRWAR
jgi:hypothetical protein